MTQHLTTVAFGKVIEVNPLEDPVGEVIGVDPASPYVERFWLPILGPSTTLLVRLLAGRFSDDPRGYRIDVLETARALGLGDRLGKNGPFLRAVERAVAFHLASVRDDTHLAVRRRLPQLSPRQVQRLPGTMAIEHRARRPLNTDLVELDVLAQRGRQLALSLLELGESVGEAERQLLRWRFEPSLARRCARWAAARHNAAAGGEVEDPPSAGPQLAVEAPTAARDGVPPRQFSAPPVVA